MSLPKSVKNAAAASEILLALWLLLTVVSYIFQDGILSSLMGYPPEVLENTGRTVSSAVAAQFLAGGLVTAANVIMLKNEARFLPVVLASFTAGLLPLLTLLFSILGTVVAARINGEYALVRVSGANQIASVLAYFLNAGMIVSIAAGAVYAYDKGRAENINT